jgi:hypothetical protein
MKSIFYILLICFLFQFKTFGQVLFSEDFENYNVGSISAQSSEWFDNYNITINVNSQGGANMACTNADVNQHYLYVSSNLPMGNLPVDIVRNANTTGSIVIVTANVEMVDGCSVRLIGNDYDLIQYNAQGAGELSIEFTLDFLANVAQSKVNGQLVTTIGIDEFQNSLYGIGFSNTWGSYKLACLSVIDAQDQDNDGYSTLDDCDDTNPNLNPDMVEVPYNGLDDDCNPSTPDDDLDGDQYILATDCNDNDANINPGQTEIAYNSLDDDCNPSTVDDDLDGDQYLLVADCDDNNPNVNPGQTEIVYNGLDDDCNQNTNDDDLDNDTFKRNEDCDDNNASVNPSKTEIPYNGLDDDCNPATLEDDLDQDSFPKATDCDDSNANVNPNATEIPYNGIEDDCNFSTVDDDLDADNYGIATDCNDLDPNINPDAIEVPNNGIDENCDGIIVTATKNIALDKFKISPNPATSTLNLEIDNINFSYVIYDVHGKTCLTGTEKNIDISTLNNGMYILVIFNDKNLVSFSKFIKM